MVLVFLVWETLGRSRESTPLIRPRSRPYWAAVFLTQVFSSEGSLWSGGA